MDYIFAKSKNPIFGVFLGVIPEMRFFPKIRLSQFFTLKDP